MRTLQHIVTVILIAFAIILSQGSALAQSQAQSALGPALQWPAATLTLPLAHGATLERSSWLGQSGWMQLTVIRVDLTSPSVTVAPVLAGGALTSPERPTAIARTNGLLAAVNGDFFDMGSTGGPLSLVAAGGGIIRSPRLDSDFASIAITGNGSAVLGKWDFAGQITGLCEDGIGQMVLTLSAMNEISVAPDSVVLYTPEWTWPRTPAQPDVVHAAIVDGIIESVQPGYPPAQPGTYVVARGTKREELQRFAAGTEVQIETGLRPSIGDLASAFSGKPVLVMDGKPASHLLKHTGIGAASAAPRTAAGVSADGSTLILAVVDGRLTGARGATLPEMAQIMISLGAQTALNLDGGGSSAVSVLNPLTDNVVQANRPSGGVQRAIPYVVGLIPTGAAATDGASPAFIAVEVANQVIPSLATATAGSPSFIAGEEVQCDAGTEVHLRVVAFDANMQRMERSLAGSETATEEPAEDDVGSSVGPVWTILVPKSLRGREIPSDIWATYDNGVSAVFRPPAGTRTELSVIWKRYDGTFTNSVSFAVRAGEPATEEPVSSSNWSWTVLCDFEDDAPWSAASSAAGVSASAGVEPIPSDSSSIDPDKGAPTGNALALAFDLRSSDATRAAYARPRQSITVPATASSLGMWAWGDGNGHWLRATVVDAQGTVHPLDFSRIDWTGWRFVTALLPEVHGALSLTQVYVVEFKPELASNGKIHIDGLSALYLTEMAEPRSAEPEALDPTAVGELISPSAGRQLLTIDAARHNLPWDRIHAALESFKAGASTELVVVMEGGAAISRLTGTVGGTLRDPIQADLLLRMLADCCDGATRVVLIQQDGDPDGAGEVRAMHKGVLMIWEGAPGHYEALVP